MSGTAKLSGAAFAFLVAAFSTVSMADASPGVSVMETSRSSPQELMIASNERCHPSISAYGKASGYAPEIVKRQIARVRAMSDWRHKVEARHGPAFVKWRAARDRNIKCDASLGALHCIAEARPCEGNSLGTLF